MKRTILICVMIFASTALIYTQSDPPDLASWLRNTTGITGYNNLPANVQLVQYSANNVYVNCSGIPAYAIGPWSGDPNIPSNQGYTFKFPRNPIVNNGTKTSTSLGPIAVWLNGVPAFNALDAMSYNNQNIWHQNAVFVEASSFDACLGHPAPGGIYHHHQNPKCLYSADSTQHSPIVGFSFDGFPIYGAYGFKNTDGSGGIARIKSSYRLRNITQRTTLPDGTVLSAPQYGPNVSMTYPLGYYVEDYEYVSGLGDLDAYNGRVTVTPEYPQGTYAYFATINAGGSSAYPYTIGTKYYGVVATENISAHGHVTISEGVTTYTPLSSPTLISPNNNALVQAIPATLLWNKPPSATLYHLQVAEDSLFISLVANDSLPNDTSFQFGSMTTNSTYYWRVKAKNTDLTSAWSSVRSFTYIALSVNRWSMVSLSRNVIDPRKSILYPTATSNAYSYVPGSGYSSQDTLLVGIGYWLKLPAGDSTHIAGDSLFTDTISVASGWNMIGSVTSPLAVFGITSIPPGITTSNFYGYNGQYTVADTITPGSGYWVKTNQSGKLIFSSSGTIANRTEKIIIVPVSEQPPSPPEIAGDQHGQVPHASLLAQNYPNPFNPVTNFEFRVTDITSVTLKIFDILGREVATLLNEVTQPGIYHLTWDASNYSSGVYIGQMRAGAVLEMKRLILMR